MKKDPEHSKIFEAKTNAHKKAKKLAQGDKERYEYLYKKLYDRELRILEQLFDEES